MRNEIKTFLERVSPEQKSTTVFKLHFACYRFAEKFVADKKVLDIGCGTGYGSDHLAQWGSEVIGGDISSEAIVTGLKLGGCLILFFLFEDFLRRQRLSNLDNRA